ncbi:ArsR/SmtB family transcription factor [Mycoplasma sp. P36-A1]|uniref:ArsR/SmtB family transcription factor n=1 Tax=Mycoplasma sp. P36-A1 TaxID=3252900 RepID=UPI003C2E524D
MDVCKDSSEVIVVEEIKQQLLDMDLANNLADFFKVFSDLTRIRILGLLSKQEVCVHEIAQILEMSQSAVSHQLKILRVSKLVKSRRQGKHMFYSLADYHVNSIIANGLEHIQE